MAYLRAASENNYARVASIQNPYSLLNRSAEVGVAEVCLREQVSFLAYSPLAFGVLSGKYLNNQKPAGARCTVYERFARYFKPNCEEATTAYVKLAKENGLEPAQLALAYINQKDFMSSNIVGATSLDQLKMNIESVELNLSIEIIAAIDAIHQKYPNPAP
jgi:aryl-alcohol dehydrogenase-like predicted oxidoreductase